MSVQRGPRLAGLALLLSALLSAGCGPVDSTPAPESGRPSATSPAPANPSPTTTDTSPSPTTEPTPELVITPPGLVLVAGIIDGDTIDVLLDGERTRIRIIGIDTPERGRCGFQQAASAMQSLVQSREVRLEADPTQQDIDAYDRLLRHVYTADGVNVAEELIAQGLGLEYTYDRPYAHRDAYLSAQAAAQEAALGLWGSLCQPLEALDGSHPVGEDGEPCLIKGNINRSQERIYHVPGQQNYDDTIIDEWDGERWFCTPEEAEEAGWRAARR